MWDKKAYSLIALYTLQEHLFFWMSKMLTKVMFFLGFLIGFYNNGLKEKILEAHN